LNKKVKKCKKYVLKKNLPNFVEKDIKFAKKWHFGQKQQVTNL